MLSYLAIALSGTVVVWETIRLIRFLLQMRKDRKNKTTMKGYISNIKIPMPPLKCKSGEKPGGRHIEIIPSAEWQGKIDKHATIEILAAKIADLFSGEQVSVDMAERVLDRARVIIHAHTIVGVSPRL